MMKNRLLSILLSCCMMLTLLPTAVFAEGSGEGTPQCVCEDVCTAEQMNKDCPVCGAKDAAPENCGQYIDSTDDNTDLESENQDPMSGNQDTGDDNKNSEGENKDSGDDNKDTKGQTGDPEESASEKVQALINELPEPDSISAENAEDVATQIAAIDAAKAQLSEEEQQALDLSRYEAAAAALAALEKAYFVMLTDSAGTEAQYFDNLSDAFNAVPGKTDTETVYTVTVLNSRKLGYDWITVAGKRVTLDLNEQTLSTCLIQLKNEAELTVTGNGSMNDFSKIEVYAKCKLYVKSGSIESVSSMSMNSGDNGTVYLQGGTIGLTLRLRGDAVLTGGTLTRLVQHDFTAMGVADSVLLSDILPEGYALESAGDPAEKLPRSTGIKENDSLRRTMHVVSCNHSGEDAIQDNRCIYCGVEDPFSYDLAKGSITVTVDETGAQTVKQGERVTPHTGAVTIMQMGSDTPTTEYGITVTAAAEQTAHIVLAGVNIDLNATGNVASSSASSSNIYSFGTAAMATYGEGNVTLELDGTNALISGQFRAGLEKHNAGMLTINDKNKVPGSLKAWGSYGGAGIGGIGCFYYFQDSHSDKFDQPYPGEMEDASVENITINGGTIEAESYANIRSYIESGGSRGDTRGGSGAGIGGGRGGTAKNITINGGTITTTAGSGAGIGGGSGGSLSRTSYIFYFGHAENITINGGTIHATSTDGAGIGGGYGISTASGDNFPKIGDRGNGKNITITGGKVTAISDSYSAYSGGAGIGGGSQGSGIGITITGGEVIAQGGNFSAGIGGGSQGSGIDITINGGTVTATGGGGGAGIGSGGYQKNPDDIIPVGKAIHILGGSVHATGGSRQSTQTALNDKGGAGIGGGYGGNGIDIRIENAEVTAIGGKGEASDSYRKDGAGIGGGGLASSNNVAYGGTGENIFISNSTITATGTYGAGIGGGQGGNGVKISIVNGTVMKAKSVRGAGIGGGEDGIGDDITITGSTVTAGSGGVETGGAGIGGGANGDGKNITITGSEVTAAGGLHGAGIGGGRNGNGESITISSGSRVTAYCGSGSPDAGTSAYGAGIGGGQAYDDEGKGKGNGRQITITDSEVLAFGSGGAGIGGGHVGVYHSASIPLDPKLGSGNGEDITIRGSKVTAYSSSGAGIGGGMTRGERYNTSRYSGMGRNITIEDSNVKAFSTCSGAGIGGGKGGDSENITIKSGTVTATGGYRGGAGIGGGGAYYGGNAKGITILGGTVTATGGSYIQEGNREGNCYWGGAGIGGGGEYHGGGDAADITISGGTVTAIGGSNASGIGGGSGSATDDFNTRGEVFAYENPWNPSVRSGCAENITISGGTVTAIGQFKASGIGGGGFYAIIEDRLTYGEDPRNPIRAAGSAKNITITGGFITAQGGTEGVSIGRSAFSFFGLKSSEEDLSASGGTFYRSIPNTVELQGHVVQYQVDGTVFAWQVVQDDGLAYLPRLTDENGVSLDEWYRENEKYDFNTPVIAGLTLTAQAHTCDGWRSDENSHWHDCTDCGKILDKAAHSYGDWEAIAYPTKEATGKWERICTVCGYAETRNLPALDDPDHSCVYDLKIVSPETQKTRGSCVQDKVYYMSCECGAISSTETFTVSGLPAHFMESGILPYNFKRSSFDVTQHWDVCASCHMIWERTKHTGTSDVQCIYCDYRKSPHDHILELIPAKAPTCTENGNIAYYICSGCSGTYKDETGNEFIQLYGEYDALKKQTITEYGSGAIILATGHSLANDEWQKGENAHWRLCACGAVFDRALHTYGGWTVTREPTTVRAGEKVRTCTDCGYVQTADIPVLEDPAHQCVYDREMATDDALKSAETCTADAMYYKSCACGAISSTETFTAAGTKLEHNWKKDWSRDGETHWHECLRCHEQKDKTAHDFGTNNVCDICKYDKSAAHTHALTLVPVRAATCTEAGNKAYYICDGCDGWFEAADGTKQITDKTSVLLPPTGHKTVGEWQTSESQHWKTCACGLVMDRAEHTSSDWIIDTPATAGVSGAKHKECIICKSVLEQGNIPATGYIITFDANGGMLAGKKTVKTGAGGRLVSLPTPTRSGNYSFDGWYTEKEGGMKVTIDKVYHTDTTLYAHWAYTDSSGDEGSNTNHKLSLETNGGSTAYAGGQKQTNINSVSNVSQSDQSYDGVLSNGEKSLMGGIGSTSGMATRGMIANILWHMEGSPSPKNAPAFTDVASGKWYSDAIAWVTENGIYQDYGNGRFGPDDPITRELLAVIFYRYASYKGYDITISGSLDTFTDKDKISTWAQDAMKWAVGNGLLQGRDNNTIDPQGTVTHAEIVAMLHDFVGKCGFTEGEDSGDMKDRIDPEQQRDLQTEDNRAPRLWSFILCIFLAVCLAVVLITVQLRRKMGERE